MDNASIAQETKIDEPLQPPWKLRDVTTNPVVRIIQLSLSWLMLDKLAGTSNFFLSYFMICFSFLIFRCSKDIVKPNPSWLANVGIVLYLLGIFIGALGFSGYITSALSDSGAAICSIDSNNKITTYYLGNNNSFQLIWLWLPIFIISLFDWAFLKTWREEAAAKKLEEIADKKNKKNKNKK